MCVCGGGWVLLGSFSAGKFQKKTHRALWGNYTPEMPYKGNKKKGIFSSVFLLSILFCVHLSMCLTLGNIFSFLTSILFYDGLEIV